MANEPLIQVKNLKKAFGNHEVLTDINLDVQAGEVVSIIGRSGSGKSTLLRNINLLETPTGGDILFHGKSILGDDVKLSTYRAKVGMVFQSFNLFNNMTVLQNVMVPQQTVLKRDAAAAKTHALELLKQVGMDPFVAAKPDQLSGGQEQRVAIARAIAKNPSLLLADEPTGALDYKTGKSILKLFEDFSHQTDKNVIIVTHNSLIKPMADHVIEIHDGEVKDDYHNDQPTPVEQLKW